MVRRLLSIVAMMLALAMVAVACGDDDSSGDGSTAAAPAGGDERTERAVAAGEQAAADAGGPVELPAKKAGILQILGSIESAQNAERNMREALDTLGWEQIVCDAQGDPTKMARCGDSLLDQNVDVMFVLGIEPSLIKAQMRKAKDQGVPVVGFGGQVGDDPLWAGKYYPDDPESGEILTEYVMERLAEVEGDKPVAVNSYPADWSRLRTDVFLEAIKGDSSIDLVAEQTTDAANLVEGTRKQVNDTLTAHPDLKVYWFGFDVAGQAGGQAVLAKFPGKAFPEKPLVVTFDADLGTQELMRAGAIDAVVDVPYYASAWIAADQAAEFFARDTPFDTAPQPEYPITIFDNVMITMENMPPEGQLRQTEDDFVTFFQTKWSEEFGTSP
jgi:ABC-type sugar transport system substrate-binding protein